MTAMNLEFKSSQCGERRLFTVIKPIGGANYNCQVYQVRPETGSDTYFLKRINTEKPTGTIKERLQFIEQDEADNRRIYEQLLGLAHKNVVKYLDYGKNEEDIRENRVCWYILQEFIPGGTLSVLCNKQPLSEPDIKKYTRQILEGLHFLHSRTPHIIHRDVKPHNIMLSDDHETLKLCDLDSSKEIPSMETLPDQMSNRTGTLVFMSPEMLRVGKRGHIVGRRTDIWSLGCVILHIIGQGRFNLVEAMSRNTVSSTGTDYEIQACIYRGGRPVIPVTVSRLLQSFLEECLEGYYVLRSTAETLLSHPFLSHSAATVAPRQSLHTQALDEMSTLSEETLKFKRNDVFQFKNSRKIHWSHKLFGFHPKRDLLMTIGSEQRLQGEEYVGTIWHPTGHWITEPAVGEFQGKCLEIGARIEDPIKGEIISFAWSEDGRQVCIGTRQGMQIWSHDGVLQSSAGEQDGFGQAWDVAWNADSKYLAYSPSLNTTCIWHVEEKRIMWSHVFEDDDISCEKRSIHCWKDHSTILIYVVVDKYHRRETRPLNQFYQVDITSPSDQSWQAVPFLTLDPKDVISKYIYRRTGFEKEEATLFYTSNKQICIFSHKKSDCVAKLRDGHWTGGSAEITARHFCMSPKWLTNNNSENMGHLALGYNDGLLEIWDIKQPSSECLSIKCLSDGNSIQLLRFSRNAKLLACCDDRIITIRDVNTGAILRRHELKASICTLDHIDWNCTSDKVVVSTSNSLTVLRLRTAYAFSL